MLDEIYEKYGQLKESSIKKSLIFMQLLHRLQNKLHLLFIK